MKMINVYTIDYKMTEAGLRDGLRDIFITHIYEEGTTTYAARSERGAVREFELDLRDRFRFRREPYTLNIRKVEKMNSRDTARWLRNSG